MVACAISMPAICETVRRFGCEQLSFTKRISWLPSILAVFAMVFSLAAANAADDPPKDAQAKTPKVRDTQTDGPLPKYPDMELPAAEDLLRSKPFDWVVLKNQEVLVVEPVSPRPDTLVRLNTDYERYMKARAGFAEGEERLREKRKLYQRVQVTLFDLGEDEDLDYYIETKQIQKIEYFEDLILRRANALIESGNIPLAYDLLLFVDRRHRDNNANLKDAYEERKKEEAAAKGDDEHRRYLVPDALPLKLAKEWPKFNETYENLLFQDAVVRMNRDDDESALRLLETLWDRNADFSGLSEKTGQVVDRLISKSIEASDFRQARHFLARLTAREQQHSVAVKWKTELTTRATNLIQEARTASSEGNAALAASVVDFAARVWPAAPGLKDAHRELTERHQAVRLGVLRLPGEPTKYPLDPPAESEVNSLTDQLLFEPVRIDERGVRYRSGFFESWEPTDLGRKVQFTLRMKRADWEARPLMTSMDVLDELLVKIDPDRPEYDERLAGVIEQVAVQSPSQFTVNFRRLPLRLEALLQFSVPLDEESLSLNPDIQPAAVSTAGRQRFYEHERSEKQIAYRRVRPQSLSIKGRNVDEVVLVRQDSWDHALQAMLRGEITGISHVGLRDLKGLQEDSRFFVAPYALPVSHFILFHPDSAPLRDGQLRRALSLAIPREELVSQTILKDVKEPLARVTSTPFPTASYGHNRLLAEPQYDPQRAAALALTAKKQLGDQLPELRLACPPDPAVRAVATAMIEHWKRVGIAVRLVDDSPDSPEKGWDLVYRTTRIVEPLTELWPMLTLQSDARIASLRTLPERIRHQLLELERSNDWTAATKLLRRIESELLIESRFIPLWEVDDFLVVRRHLVGLPTRPMHPYHDVERWTLQSWYPQETP